MMRFVFGGSPFRHWLTGVFCSGLFVATSAQAAPGDQLWEFQADSAVNCAPALGEDGTVFIGVNSGRVYAVDGDTGAQKWEFQTDGACASPVLGANDLVYVGTSSGTLYALKVASGLMQWSNALGGELTAPAIGTDGGVYVGSSAGSLFSLAGASGATNWVYALNYPVNGSPTVGNDGVVYVGAAGVLHAVDQLAGTNRWKFSVTTSTAEMNVETGTAFSVGKSLVVLPVVPGDGMVYALMNLRTENGGPDWVPHWDGLAILDAASGELKKLVSQGGSYLAWALGPFLGADGKIIAGYSCSDYPIYGDGSVFAVDPEDTVVSWAFDTGRVGLSRYYTVPFGVTSSGSLGADGTLYFCSAPIPNGSCGVTAINGVSGQKMWAVSLASASVHSSPAIGADGTLYVGSEAGKLYALAGNTNLGLAATAWPKVFGNSRNSGGKSTIGDNYILRRVAIPVTVAPLAGSGQAAFQDATGADAAFNAPAGCWAAADGTVYVADTGNHRIRRVGADGVVTTVAGTGVAGHQDGPVATAQFNGPLGVCLDSQGDLWVTETNHYVRRITADGQVITVAGTGVAGLVDGPGLSAQFNVPRGIVVDNARNAWVADSANHALRKLAADGAVSTWVGNGAAEDVDGAREVARLNGPSGLARGSTGVLYVSETGGNRIRQIALDGQVTTVAGSGVTGCIDRSAGAARFNQPAALGVDEHGNLWVADTRNHVVRRLAVDGTVQTVAGIPVAAYAEGNGKAARFSSPGGIGVDGRGTVYVVDTGNARVRKLSLSYDISLVAIPDQTVDVLQTLTLPMRLTDSNSIGHAQFSLLAGAPEGMSIDAQTGVLTWTPTLLQGRTTYRVPVQIDDGQGVLDTKYFTVTVTWPAEVPGGQRWKFSAGGALSGCPAIDDDGTVYIGSADNKVYALVGGTGEIKWVADLGSKVSGSPSVSRLGLVYVGVEDGTLYALDVTKGMKKWVFPTGQLIKGAPAIGSEREIFFGAGTNLYAVDAINGKTDWVYSLANPVGTAPVIDQAGTLYIADQASTQDYWNSAMTLYAIHCAHGNLQWKSQPLQLLGHSSLALGGDGELLFGSDILYQVDARRGELTNSVGPIFTEGMPNPGASDYTTAYWGHVDEVVFWLISRQWDLAPVTGPRDEIYCGMHNRSIWKTGAGGWSFKPAEAAYLSSAPAVGADGTVYAGTLASNLCAIDGATGSLLWRFPADDIPSAVAMGPDGTVYLSTATGALYAVTGNASGGLARGAWPKYQADAANTGSLLPANRAPELAELPIQTVNEQAGLIVRLTATDPDVLGSTLTYGLVSAPEGVALDSAAGTLTWTPTEAQGPSTNTITVSVTDDGVPALSATNRFTVIVKEVKHAPVFTAPEPQVIDEMAPFTLRLVATDPDIPTNTSTFSLDSAPDGLELDPVTGVLTWTPTEAQGPSTNLIKVRVLDNSEPPMGTVGSFTITVREVNQAPRLTTAIQAYTVLAGARLSFTNTASDADWPANGLTYQLGAGAPGGATLDAQTGVFTCVAPAAAGTNRFSITVTDNGVPSLSDTQSFTVITVGAAEPIQLAGIVRLAEGRVQFSWNTVVGGKYRVQTRTQLNADAWTDAGEAFTATGASGSYTDPAATQSQRFYRVIRVE